MPILLLRFPGRRYHATPWGHHVNEGLVEWPPSPWRLLRALLCVGYTHLGWPDDGPPPAARRLIHSLAKALPCYRLPRAAGAHSRHYMPVGKLEGGEQKKTLVFDTWAHVGNDTLGVRWDVALPDDERDLLAALAANLNYLGRSESWVDATLGTDDLGGFEVIPDTGAPLERGWEQVSLMAPVMESDYEAWRSQAVEQARAATGVILTKPRLTKPEQQKLQEAEAPFPPTLIDCLQAETSWLRGHGWSQAPGSRKVLYVRRRDALEVGAPVTQRRERDPDAVEMMLLAMASGSRSKGLLPHTDRTLPQAELLHRALVSHEQLAVFTGSDEARQPLRGPHQHAHIMPLDLDGDHHLDHVLLWAPMGFDGLAQAAVRATRRTFTKGGAEGLQLMLVASGAVHDLMRLPGPVGARLAHVLGAEPSITWTSLTPFVPPRHLKARGKHTLEGQLQAELASRGLPPARAIVVRDPHSDDDARRARHVVRARQRGPRPSQDRSFVIELTLERPARGPLALGYGSHFGLGVFVASQHEALAHRDDQTNGDVRG